jgi:hypothetical protein
MNALLKKGYICTWGGGMIDWEGNYGQPGAFHI